ncbi:MAG: 6-hydroxy-D-nicotine oxidase [Caldilinea sp. CFX5]|nr:6-hydroxy-D-nicotine oxidase [Caldilinea sp. CFX5]
MTTLQIRLLGHFSITYQDAPLPGVDSPRLQAFFAYLLLHSRSPQTRQQLAFHLWPDSSESQARNNLRKLIHQLRRAFPLSDHCFQVNSRQIQWQPTLPYTLDVSAFVDKVHQAQSSAVADGATRLRLFSEAVALYQGDLLTGCYDDWIFAERERLRQLLIEALEQVVGLAEDQRDYGAAIRHANHLLRVEPLQENSYLHLMRLHALQGDRAAALQTYHTCVTILQRELAVEPGEAVQLAYQRLLDQGIPPRISRPALPQPGATLRLVGRQAEWQTLRNAWALALRTQAHFCLIRGEAGIGKTRLAEELLTWAERQGIATATTRSYAAEGALAYAPVIEWLRSPPLQTALATLADPWLTEVARLLPELLVARPTLPRPAPLTDQWQRQRLFEALARAFTSDGQPKLLLIDDLQWCDGETLAWLHYLCRFTRNHNDHPHRLASLLVLGTARSEEIDAAHPLTALLLDLRRNDEITELPLTPLNASATAELAAQIATTPLMAETAQAIYHQSEGNPLFVVEMVRSGMENWRTGDWSASASRSSLPPKVQSVIQRRLNQLSLVARQLLGLAATIGRSFSFALLQQASSHLEDELVQRLDELWQRGLVREQGMLTYDFSHDRIRETAYALISPAQRALWHKRVAQALEALYADDLDAVSAQIAVHQERAGILAAAILYYQRAAAVMQRTYANEEAIHYLRQGLALLNTLPGNQEHVRQELSIQIALGPLLIAARGFSSPEVEKTYLRARALCEQMEDQSQLFPVLWGLWAYYFTRAEHQRAWRIGQDLLTVAHQTADPALLLEAHHALWTSVSYLGDFAAARIHCEQGVAVYDPQQHFPLTFQYGGHDAGVCCRNFYGPALWFLGYPDQAVQNNQAALTLAEKLAHPFSLALALHWLAVVHQLRNEAPAAQVNAEGRSSWRPNMGSRLFWAGHPAYRGGRWRNKAW